MLTRSIEVRETHLGHGVFALREFAANEEVGSVTGNIVDGETYSSDYAIDLSDTQSLEPDAPFRFLNHCCVPNCELIVWEDEGRVDDLSVISTRPIQPGDELTIDYAWPANHAIPCLCRHPECRGWIVTPEELDEVLAQKLDGADKPLENESVEDESIDRDSSEESD